MPEIATLGELSELVDQDKKFWDKSTTTVIYRGHGAKSFGLRPKAGRVTAPPDSATPGKVNEELMLELFRNQSVDRLTTPCLHDWELLAIAQHHGLPTRLLDWTRSPLVALYFAVCKECETRSSEGKPEREDAEIIAWTCEKHSLKDTREFMAKHDPFSILETIRYVPRIVTLRLRVQKGLFTVHHDPWNDYQPPGRVVRFRIPYEKRKHLKESLFYHGIDESVLFPDRDGLAHHIEWCQTDSY